MTRTVEIVWSGEFDIDQVRQATDQKLDQALGYLASWAIGSPKYAHVYIIVNADYELSAIYTPEPHSPGKTQPHFLLVGIWSATNRRYTFHS